MPQKPTDKMAAFFNELQKEATESFMDQADIKKMEQPQPGSVTQESLGLEHNEEANKNGGINAPTAPKNKDSDGTSPIDKQGPSTLDADEPVKTDGNIGPMRSQEITQEQKTAGEAKRYRRIANGIRGILGMQKKAEDMSFGEDGEEGEKDESDETEGTDSYGGDGGEGGDGPDYGDMPKEAADAMRSFDKFQKVAMQIANQRRDVIYKNLLDGYVRRQEDEQALRDSSLFKQACESGAARGPEDVSAIIFKQAMEDPTSVMPEEVVSQADELDQAVNMLDEAGVQPEDVEQAQAVVQELLDSGAQPEDIQAAVSELVDESLAPEGAPVEKVAADNFQRRASIETIKRYMLQKNAAAVKVVGTLQGKKQKQKKKS